jgi:hypothetical protein
MVVEISECTHYFLSWLSCIAQTAFNGDPTERVTDAQTAVRNDSAFLSVAVFFSFKSVMFT